VVIAFAGRFDSDLVAAAAKGLVQALPEPGLSGWGMAFCYGNRLETLRGDKPGEGGYSFEELAEVKTDMALLALNEARPGALPMPVSRRDKGRDWAWCPQAAVLADAGGEPASEYVRQLLLELDTEDPLASTEKVRATGPNQSFFFIGVELLLADLRVNAVAGQEPGAWMGKGQLVSILSPVPLPQLSSFEWEPVPVGSTLVLTRFRHELP
jgi:hypothetical protein